MTSTTYVIIIQSDSPFDKSLKWFVKESQEQETDKGLEYQRSISGHPPAALWQLLTNVEKHYEKEGE